MITLWAWILSNWRLVAAGGALVLAGGVVYHLRSDWVAEGRRAASADATAESKKAWEADRSSLVSALAAANDREAALVELTKAAEANAARYAALATAATGRADALAKAATAVPVAVAAVADADLSGAIRAELAVRPAGDATPGFEPPELRAILSDVRLVPLLQSQVGELRDANAANAKESAELRSSLAATNDRLAVAAARTAAYAEYSGALESHYAEAFNALPRRRTFLQHICGIFTFYRACRPAHVSLPPPAELLARRPA